MLLRILGSIASAIEWLIIASALLMVTGLLDPAGAEECDCAQFAYEVLKRAHVKLATVPAIVGTLGPNGYYRGVVRIHFPQPCMVYVHEFVHHDQWLRGYEAPSVGGAVWWSLEENAEKVAARALENTTGGCYATAP